MPAQVLAAILTPRRRSGTPAAEAERQPGGALPRRRVSQPQPHHPVARLPALALRALRQLRVARRVGDGPRLRHRRPEHERRERLDLAFQYPAPEEPDILGAIFEAHSPEREACSRDSGLQEGIPEFRLPPAIGRDDGRASRTAGPLPGSEWPDPSTACPGVVRSSPRWACCSYSRPTPSMSAPLPESSATTGRRPEPPAVQSARPEGGKRRMRLADVPRSTPQIRRPESVRVPFRPRPDFRLDQGRPKPCPPSRDSGARALNDASELPGTASPSLRFRPDFRFKVRHVRERRASPRPCPFLETAGH